MMQPAWKESLRQGAASSRAQLPLRERVSFIHDAYGARLPAREGSSLPSLHAVVTPRLSAVNDDPNRAPPLDEL
jgi:hypothetical protein